MLNASTSVSPQKCRHNRQQPVDFTEESKSEIYLWICPAQSGHNMSKPIKHPKIT